VNQGEPAVLHGGTCDAQPIAAMTDFIFILVTIAFFGIAVAYTTALEKL
jgi:hypothetical protein